MLGGSYTVREVLPSGYIATSTLSHTVLANNTVTGQNFGNFPTVFNPTADPKVISSASTGQTAGSIKQPLIQVYVNNLPCAAFLTSTNLQAATFPTGFMGPCMAIMNATGSSPPTLTIDWIRVAQLANS